MRKIGFILMALVIVFSFTSAVAQGQSSSTEKSGVYTIEKGDTLWWLEGYRSGNPSQWRRIVEENPFLNEAGRIYEKGDMTIALIRPGEELKGLVNLGIIPRAVPLSELQVQSEPQVESGSIWYLLLGLAIAAALYLIYRFRRVFSDPAASGQPVIRGGLFTNRPRDIENRFQEIAETRITRSDPVPQRISPIEEGFLTGYGRVQYRDRSEMRRLNREPAYRARFRFHNGTEEDLYFLQRCANDVVLFGARYLGFTFEHGYQVVPEPQVQSGVRASLRVAASGAPTTTRLEIGGLEITAPEGSTIQVANDRVIIAVSHACDITVDKGKKSKKAKTVKSAVAQTP